MGFLTSFFENVFSEQSAPHTINSFEHLGEEDLEAHLGIARYGDFMLTEAVRPSYDLQVVPSGGYRHDVYHDEQNNMRIPVLMVSASREKLFDLFIELLDPLGESVDVVLETSHSAGGGSHTDLYREGMDLPVLKSTLYDYEEMLTDDGCTGIAVLNPNVPLEVQFDEHKLLVVYGEDLTAFEEILADHGIEAEESMKFITEAEHVHSSSEEFQRQFSELQTHLGMDASFA